MEKSNDNQVVINNSAISKKKEPEGLILGIGNSSDKPYDPFKNIKCPNNLITGVTKLGEQ